MSQYLNFFVRHNEDFIPLANYSRNTHVYDIAGIIITIDNFDEILGAIHDITNMISEYQEDIETLEREAIEIEFMRNMTYDDCEIFAGIEISDPTIDDIG